ncbi:MAG TPA: DNA mismatch repair protein MutS [Dehalococcoidia bacterium]|nr:DNA mismatch repair protein MutS [Dehalococcoidia bacterium]
MAKMTPIRSQYLRIKKAYPGAIVLFRLGDFYETFDEDAKLAARELEITLTSREMGKGLRVPLAGIPYHALDGYLAKLVSKGYKVAICEQMTPASGRGLVAREVVRVVTPGTVVETALLQGKANNYLAAVVAEADEAGLAYVDITTSEFATTQLPSSSLALELGRLQPAEVIVPEGFDSPDLLPFALTRLEGRWFDVETARQRLLDHFQAATLEGYGCAHLPLAIRAAGAILHYLEGTQKPALGQLGRLTTYTTQSFMVLDAHTRNNLELFQGSRWGTATGSLLSVIDLTRTAMGGRLLRRWLGQPLLNLEELVQRQDAIHWFYAHAMPRARVMSLLGQVADLERLINRVRGNIASPRELISLCRGLELIPEIMKNLDSAPEELKPCPETVELIHRAIAEAPGASPGEGTVIKAGFSAELDELRELARNAKAYLANLERQERERTGIKSLKVGYNKVFGYYIEVSRPNLPQVPADYIRKQTLTEAERFFTPQLKEYESAILNAQERINELETNLFRQVCQQVASQGERILASARALAWLDVVASLAEVAVRYGYTRPRLTHGDEIIIRGGRHPVVERFLGEGEFIPNDTYLSNKDAQLIILTGPNMSGKSTYIRQVALIVLLAQIGSFVPAQEATIGLVDRIFTRVGLRDDIPAGQSTFMVEMVETAHILNNATPRSLVILDEIGRGTSTYDGISIAQAVAEYIHNHPHLGTKTLFATHYHELTGLAAMLPRVKNFNVAVAEEGGKVVFLHKIIPGGSDRSYGIHVAQLAGLPRSVVYRAQEVLSQLEADRQHKPSPKPPPALQLPLLGPGSPILEELQRLDIDSMTPLEAITKLYELQRKARESQA